MTAYPARRTPDGFVAQRIFDVGDEGEHHTARGPWVSTHLGGGSNLAVSVHTDDEVVAWPVLLDPDPPVRDLEAPG